MVALFFENLRLSHAATISERTKPRFFKICMSPWSFAYFSIFSLTSPTHRSSRRCVWKCFRHPLVYLHTYSFVHFSASLGSKGQLNVTTKVQKDHLSLCALSWIFIIPGLEITIVADMIHGMIPKKGV